MNPLANMFVSIVNASRARHESVLIPFSKFKMEIARFLHQKGYIADALRRGKKNKRCIEIILRYDKETPSIHGIKQISKQSQRIYGDLKDFKALRTKRGMVVVSTSKGLLSSKEAEKQKVGGEIIAQIW